MCEEVKKPAIQVPRAIIGGVLLNMLAGLAFLLPIAFVLPDIAYLAQIPSGQPVPTIIKSAVGNSAGAFCLLIPLLVLGLTCGICCVTATSRCTWAFARDGAIPGSGWWKKVDEYWEIPLNAMALGMVVEIILGCIYFGSSAAFNAFSGVGVIFLTLSYACPVAVSMFLTKRREVKTGSFNLGPLGWFCNVVTICEFFTTLSGFSDMLTFQAGHFLLCLSSVSLLPRLLIWKP
jgi:amino acid transporter